MTEKENYDYAKAVLIFMVITPIVVPIIIDFIARLVE
jgi:hypothetical protein